MSGNVVQFASWARALGEKLPVGSELNVQVSDDSAFIDVDAPDGTIGRLIYWEDGSADCTIFDPQGELIDLTRDPAWDGPWEGVTSPDFDVAFARFITAFARSEGAS